MLMKPYIKFPTRAGSVGIPWRVPHLCASYAWPSELTGGGVIPIIELGGGYLASDTQKFFASVGLPHPSITDVSVDSGVGNAPGSDADAEVALDIQVAGASYSVATGKPATIRMYWAGNDDGGIARAVTKAAADGCDVCSISWGAAEPLWPRAAALQMEAAAQAAVAAGMVVFAASGDNNADDGDPPNPHVDLPAGCPHVIACGGTMRPHNPGGTTPETAWNGTPGDASGEGTGGGFESGIFGPMPVWQTGAPHGSGKLVPDVSANADPRTGYHIILRGQDVVVGGTSAVAPLYAGLFAAFGRKLGWVGPALWGRHLAFNDITVGDNGFYRALVGPDPCTGLGSPRGTQLAALFMR